MKNIILNPLNLKMQDKELELSKYEFWIMFFKLRNIRKKIFTDKEIDILARYIVNDEEFKGNEKSYFNKLEKRGIVNLVKTYKDLDLNTVTFLANIKINES